MSNLRLLVVASDPLARAGLVTLLADREGFEIVGQVESGETLGEDVDIYQPDVIVWDLGWEVEESLGGLEALSPELAESGLGIVVLAADEDSAISAWEAGARGLLFRNTTSASLLAAITSVANGLTTLEPEILVSMGSIGTVQEPGPSEELTPRELEVLQLLAQGMANRAIAQQLDISQHTVKFHVKAIMGKLGAQSRTAAVIRATRLGLVVL